MTTISTLKKLAASSAIAGSLGIAALSLGAGLAQAAPSTGTGSSTSAESSPVSKVKVSPLKELDDTLKPTLRPAKPSGDVKSISERLRQGSTEGEA